MLQIAPIINLGLSLSPPRSSISMNWLNAGTARLMIWRLHSQPLCYTYRRQAKWSEKEDTYPYQT